MRNQNLLMGHQKDLKPVQHGRLCSLHVDQLFTSFSFSVLANDIVFALVSGYDGDRVGLGRLLACDGLMAIDP